MYGLRKINNSYVSNGSGRDTIIIFDPYFLSGKLGLKSLHHPDPFNGGPPQHGPPHAYNAFKGPPVGDAWVVGDQTVTKSHNQRHSHNNSYAVLKTKEILEKSVDAEKKLVKSFSLPNLGSQDEHWSRVRGTTSEFPKPRPRVRAPDTRQLFPRQAQEQPPAQEPNYPFPNDANRHQYYGFSRTNFGGLWKVSSFVGPG
eukprot:GEMP01054167.1.p1 GENE.GEMP01054167.1~~GEMP01054167.1.p1  ORF type:complete len:220 (+),score=30.51 GEMP01054167.1:66-662(+)